ncbi:oxysterol-binding protein 1a [Naegleria gruberi]|uniref:Oxysterol-binding protein 1a n=1 Tax=Naegleria gruberi TaxID=5762 RepID=D2VBA6_NAEGR|nr:oxysterol-binding protein 1a [Naegleria gruberi]EFC45762.1 oxysterol-binding protein 1a [Naegleria gruberi]|eukprot:XP_002678506.1 oxysterol-binding protein 1a [Naegleria gruberi strain NEG-M]
MTNKRNSKRLSQVDESANNGGALGETYFGSRIWLNNVGKDGRATNTASGGGYLFTNEEEIKEQRKGVWDMVKKLGGALLEGKDLVSVSLPVYIFEPRSFLQRLPDIWAFHSLLTDAADQKDPVQRFIRIIAFGIAGLHQTCVQKKPFNPILGETFEGSFSHSSDPSKDIHLFVEQTSHHPPITAYEAQGKDFRLHGYCGYQASIRGNALKGGQIGPTFIEFESDGAVIQYSQPLLWLKGICWGDRVLEYYDKMSFTDAKNQLTCDIQFNPDQKSFLGSFFSSQKTPVDYVKGEVKKDGQVIGVIEGSWLGNVYYLPNQTSDSLSSMKEKEKSELEKLELFNIAAQMPRYLRPSDNPLPSDARFREDAVALRNGDQELSQLKKEELENKQRKERQLRKTGSSKTSLSSANSQSGTDLVTAINNNQN